MDKYLMGQWQTLETVATLTIHPVHVPTLKKVADDKQVCVK